MAFWLVWPRTRCQTKDYTDEVNLQVHRCEPEWSAHLAWSIPRETDDSAINLSPALWGRRKEGDKPNIFVRQEKSVVRTNLDEMIFVTSAINFKKKSVFHSAELCLFGRWVAPSFNDAFSAHLFKVLQLNHESPKLHHQQGYEEWSRDLKGIALNENIRTVYYISWDNLRKKWLLGMYFTNKLPVISNNPCGKSYASTVIGKFTCGSDQFMRNKSFPSSLQNTPENTWPFLWHCDSVRKLTMYSCNMFTTWVVFWLQGSAEIAFIGWSSDIRIPQVMHCCFIIS